MTATDLAGLDSPTATALPRYTSAHLLGETGDLVVTGLTDIDEARLVAAHFLIHEHGRTEQEATEMLATRTARSIRGSMVPASSVEREWLGYTFWWRESTTGRARAVTFEEPDSLPRPTYTPGA